LANVVAEDLWQLGYDSVVLANPFSPEFQGSFSSDGLIGLPQRDLPDAHRTLAAAFRHYVAEHGKPRRLVLAGISLGALYAALEAAHRQDLRFDQVLALNPPTSLRAGISQLDEMIRISIAESDPLPFNFQVIWAYLQAQHGTTLENIRGIKMVLPEAEREGRRLIGDSFRQALTAVGRGLLALGGATLSDSVRQRIAAGLPTLTFARLADFSGQALAERREIKGSAEAALGQVDLVSVLRRAESPAAITVVTNADDFLLQPGDLPRLEKILGDRLYVFAAGGHCGNFWTPSFRRVLAKILR
jgi:pimeloyl-ACP methyl ester carboxylesterase